MALPVQLEISAVRRLFASPRGRKSLMVADVIIRVSRVTSIPAWRCSWITRPAGADQGGNEQCSAARYLTFALFPHFRCMVNVWRDAFQLRFASMQTMCGH